MPFANRLPLRSTRLLDQLRERIRYCHYSLRTEQAYVFWVRRFIRFHGMRHPREMGGLEVEKFLTDLATRKHVSPSTHKQALSAILYLYREVLSIELPWMGAIGRPQARRRLPVVFPAARLPNCCNTCRTAISRSLRCCTAQGCGCWNVSSCESKTSTSIGASSSCVTVKAARIVW